MNSYHFKNYHVYHGYAIACAIATLRSDRNYYVSSIVSAKIVITIVTTSSNGITNAAAILLPQAQPQRARVAPVAWWTALVASGGASRFPRVILNSMVGGRRTLGRRHLESRGVWNDDGHYQINQIIDDLFIFLAITTVGQ